MNQHLNFKRAGYLETGLLPASKRNLEMLMTLKNSNSNSKPLFVPINEFEFNSFVVRVQRLGSRKLKGGGESLQRGSRLCLIGRIAPRFFES